MAEAKRRGEWARRRRLKIGLLLGCAVILTALMLALDRAGTLERLEFDTVDARFAIRGAQPTPNDVVVVGVDDVSLGEINLRFQDWPRTYYARVLRNLARAGTRAVIFDWQITEPAADEREDIALYEAAGAAAPVIFATTEVDENGGTGVFGNTAKRSAANLRAIAAEVGQGLLPSDAGGVIRRMAYSRDGLRSLGVVAAQTVEGRIPSPSGREGSEWIDYYGPPGTIESIPFSRVYHNKVDPARLRGKVVVVGLTAPTLQDVHATSAGGGLMPGPEIQATAFDTARQHFPLRSASTTVSTLLVVLLGCLAPLLTLRLSPLRALPIVAGVAVVFAVAAQLAFESGTVLLVVAPLLALVLTAVGSLVVDYFTETRERKRLRASFSRYVPEAVVDQVVDRGEARLGGERLVSTVLFCDLRGFTSFAEGLQPQEVIELLNTYLGEMSDAILNHGGTLVAYMGDGIMAVFGAPIELDDHADRALSAALEMLHVRLPRFNAWINTQGMSGTFTMGIGLNSGPVMSGNVGSERRMEYTAVGDTTNTAARLEAMTKDSVHQLFVAASTHAMLKGHEDVLEPYRDVEVRGRQALLTIWVPAQEVPHEQSHGPVARR